MNFNRNIYVLNYSFSSRTATRIAVFRDPAKNENRPTAPTTDSDRFAVVPYPAQILHEYSTRTSEPNASIMGRVEEYLLHHRVLSTYAAGETRKGLPFIAPKLHEDR